MKHPPKYRIFNVKNHVEFVRKLRCCICNETNGQSRSLDGRGETTIPICTRHKTPSWAAAMARELEMLSGDFYSAIIIADKYQRRNDE